MCGLGKFGGGGWFGRAGWGVDEPEADATDAIDYDGQLSEAYEPGRRISAEARATWWAAVEPYVAAAGVVADLGAGTGRFARLLAESSAARVIAVEPAAGMLSVGTGLAPDDTRWVSASAEHIALRSASVDVVWSAFATHYFDLPAAARECARVLKPGGHMLIWHAYPEVFDQLEWYRWFPSSLAIDHARMATAAEVIDVWADAGLHLVDRSVHQMRLTDDLDGLADRLAHRAISTLRLIDDAEFETGIANLRARAAETEPAPVYSPNMMLVFAGA